MNNYSYSRIADNFPDDMNWHRFDQKYSDGGCANEQAIEDGFEGFRGGLCFDCAYEDDCPDYEDYQEYQDLKEEQIWGKSDKGTDKHESTKGLRGELSVMCPFCQRTYSAPHHLIAQMACPFCEIEKVGVESVKNCPFKVGDKVITHDLTDKETPTFKNAIAQGRYRLYQVAEVRDFSYSAPEFYKLFPGQAWLTDSPNVRYYLEPAFYETDGYYKTSDCEQLPKRKWYSNIRMRKFNERRHGTAQVYFRDSAGSIKSTTYNELKKLSSIARERRRG